MPWNGIEDQSHRDLGYPADWSYKLLGGGPLHNPWLGTGGSRATTHRAVDPSGNAVILKKYHNPKNLEEDLLVMDYLHSQSQSADLGFTIQKWRRSEINSLVLESGDFSGMDLRSIHSTSAAKREKVFELIAAYNAKVDRLYSFFESKGMTDSLHLSYSGYLEGKLKSRWTRIYISTITGVISIPTPAGPRRMKLNVRDDNVLIDPSEQDIHSPLAMMFIDRE